jgi:molybdopterin-guanine dinucleotide biosynthesis protein MobB
MNYSPSPAVAIVGRHNSGKTTVIEKIISELTKRGFDVGSVKHHSHDKFDIDYPGKDSYRHRAAGATETVIASPVKLARVKTLDHEMECFDIVRSMPGHDVIIVEGYRKSGLPTLEIMRAGNPADMAVAKEFLKCAQAGVDLGCDFVQIGRGEGGQAGDSCGVDAGDKSIQPSPSAISKAADCGCADGLPEGVRGMNVCDCDIDRMEDLHARDLVEKMPGAHTVGVITDIPEAGQAARLYGIPSFDINDVEGVCDYIIHHAVKPRISVVIQAGGESRRMGRSKATVPFRGRPLIMHMVERLKSAADELIITTNEPENLEFLHEEYPELGIRLVTDDYNFRGALPGLHTAVNAATNSLVAVVACDMVFASAPLVLSEAYEMILEGCDVVVPVNSHGFEPFHAMYRKETCLPGIKRALDNGSTRAQSLFDDPAVKVYYFGQEAVLQAEPRGGCFINANTPDELARLEESYIGE